jgi:hypothetical protein
MNRSIITLVLTVLFTLLTISFVSAEGQKENGVYQEGLGMMGESTDDCDYGESGMMDGPGNDGNYWGNSMMGGSGAYGMMSGNGMMGSYGNFSNFPDSLSGERLTMEEVEENVLNYLEQRRMESLELNEIMEFQSNFYVQIKESDTGINAFELLIDPYYGYVTSEPGPNMMWNSKYGHMGGWKSGEMSVSEVNAISKAQEFLDSNSSGISAEEHADKFYGYYTIHTIKDGKVEGMLSVNGYSGDVWYHSWHGAFLQMEESTDNH